MPSDRRSLQRRVQRRKAPNEIASEEEFVDDEPILTFRRTQAMSAAKSLHGVSTFVLVMIILGTVGGVLAGIGEILNDHRVAGVIWMIASVLGGIASTLPSFAGMAIARYIEFRADE